MLSGDVAQPRGRLADQVGGLIYILIQWVARLISGTNRFLHGGLIYTLDRYIEPLFTSDLYVLYLEVL